jgi:two-component sensor histidine kinase
VFSLNLLSDILMAAAFCVIPGFFIVAISRLERLSDRFKMASVLYSLGMIFIAASILAPHFWPSITGTFYEFVIKVLATATIVSASYVSWPFVRLATEYRRSMALLPETELLILERDDLEAAKTELEKEIVKRSYQLERVNRQMRLALLGSPITVFRQDLDFRYTWIFNAPDQTTEEDFIGKTDDEIFPPDVALTLAEVKKMAVETHEEQSAETYVRYPHGNFWYLLRTQPDYDEDNEIIGTLSCAIDITEQKRQQQRQHLLMREVTHRSKNLLAVLQSIVRQTARRTRNTEEFLTQLTARLQSIAQSHDLLVNDDWSGTSLRKLLDSQLNVLSDITPERISIKGQDLLLTSVAVQNFGLAFHELATNALKYGSLSGNRGKLAIEWKITGGKTEGQLQFIWRESGGPAVELSKESGFGRTLLERVVGKALGGTVDMDFSAGGLVCTMALPVSRTIANWENDTPAAPSDHYATA